MHKILFYIGIIGTTVFMQNIQADTFTSVTPGAFPSYNQPGNPGFHTADIVYPGVATIKAGEFQFDLANLQYSFGNEMDILNTHFVGVLDAFGTETSFNLNGATQATVFGKTSPGEVGSFSTQITSMNLSGIAGGHFIQMMLNPTIGSTGFSSISANGAGEFNISSFFDVFVELSIDGGAITLPSGPVNAKLATTVAEPATVILMGMGWLGLVRRRHNA